MTTLVNFLLDRTGSMQSIKNDTMGAFNAYIEGLQKDDKAEILFSFSQFDAQRKTLVVNERTPVKEVKPLNDENYHPSGGTNLIDSAYAMITDVDSFLKSQIVKPKVVICIQTDGEENSSVEHTWEQLNTLIKAKTEQGWQFNFMGAGIDAYKQSIKMGISMGATVSYNSQDAGATRAAFLNSAHNHSHFATGELNSVEFSAKQKAQAGDIYDTK